MTGIQPKHACALAGSALALALTFGLAAITADPVWSQPKPCPTVAQNHNLPTGAAGAQTAQNHNLPTGAAGTQTAQNYNPPTGAASGAQTAQNYNPPTGAASNVQTAQNYNRGTDTRAGGVQVASNFDRSTDPHSSAGVGHAESATADGMGCN